MAVVDYQSIYRLLEIGHTSLSHFKILSIYLFNSILYTLYRYFCILCTYVTPIAHVFICQVYPCFPCGERGCHMIQMMASSLLAFIFIPHISKKTSYQSDSCYHQAPNIMFKLFEQA